MINGLLLLADGFEMVEAFLTMDVLHRTHQIALHPVACGNGKTVTSSSGLEVVPEFRLETIPGEFDFLVLPGGKLGVSNLASNENVLALIRSFQESGKPVFAICAAPSILGNLGYLDGKRYTCFPGFQTGNGFYQNEKAVRDGDLITGHSMGCTMEFAHSIVSYFLGEEAYQAILPGVMGGLESDGNGQ